MASKVARVLIAALQQASSPLSKASPDTKLACFHLQLKMQLGLTPADFSKDGEDSRTLSAALEAFKTKCPFQRLTVDEVKHELSKVLGEKRPV